METVGLYFNVSPSPAPRVSETPGSSAVLPYTRELSIGLRVLAPLWPVIITFGYISNTINIIVFIKAGVKENVTTLLLSLAISDLTFLILITPTMCGIFIKGWGPDHSWPFDYKFSYFLFYWPAFTAYDLSALISVSLGVMRCACVSMPLKFKMVFTKSRTVKWVMFLVVLAVAIRAPVLTIFRVAHKRDPKTNVSTPVVIAVNLVAMTRINDVMNRGFVIWFNYITMVTCVIVLTYKLRQAAKIRRSCTTGNKSAQASEKTDANSHQTKDLQVIKSVVLICTIFILSQMLFLLVSTLRLADSNFAANKELGNLFTLISQTSLTLSYLNASLNIFVYYNFNSKYRSTFLTLFDFKQAA
ncbi:peptide receptor GPCR [Elysia marginata]|uniref:Peptide receptor GPCR n=1 Tax=Elysia marginata TaxID=1093978 RepID=A0AAV4F4C5_9GAST|nr:peptide receptor GPCR [Elysia marginata]